MFAINRARPFLKRELRYFTSSRINNEISKTIELPPKDITINKFNFQKQTHTISQISQDYENFIKDEKKVVLNGWIDGVARKLSKNLYFASFRDTNGDTAQIVGKSEELVKLLRTLKPEDSLSLKCSVRDTKSSKGSYELEVEGLEILNKSGNIAAQLESLKESDPSLFPPDRRYLQLRSQFYQNALKMRSKTAGVVRDTFRSLDFTEVETPLLFKSTPEGAKEFLVPTRSDKLFYALPQSPQQYKQLLMASGVKNYYQIAKCFRDEDLRSDRQPEFTQIDMEMSFATADDVKNVVTKLVTEIWSKVRNLKLYKPVGTQYLKELEIGEQFPDLPYSTALSLYGIDKPDLRSSISFQNVTEYFEPKFPEFGIVELCVLKQAFDHTKGCKFPKALSDPQEYKSRKPIIIPIKTKTDLVTWKDKVSSRFKIKDDKFDFHKLNVEWNLQPGDIIAVCDRAEQSYENPTPLGRFRQLAIKEFPNKWQRQILDQETVVSPDDIFVASWVVDFPLFSPVENESNKVEEGYPGYDYKTYESTHHPFTMAQLKDYDHLSTDPLRVHGDHYDLVVNGVELGGGSRRVHDSQLQRYIFTNILKIQDPDYLFGHLLTALSTGCPPHAGLAIGFDRMCAMLLNSGTIRDVIAFPKTQSGSDPVVGSPSGVPLETLATYHIKPLAS